MVYIRAEIRRGILRQIVEGAIPARITVGAALLAFQSSINSPSFRQGRVMVNTSGNGQSASFEIGLQGKSYTQENVFSASEEYLQILSDSLASNPALVDDSTEANSRAVFAAMVSDDRLQTVTRRGTDFTLLNFPQGTQVAPSI